MLSTYLLETRNCLMQAIFDQFKLRAEAVSAEVHRFSSNTSALQFIVRYLQDAGVADSPDCYAVWADCPFLRTVDKKQVAALVPGLTFEVTREKAAAAKVGISQLDWAMANTGSLIQDAAPIERRLVSTLPNIHIAIVETNRLLPDMPAVFSKIRPSRRTISPSSPAPAAPPTSSACSPSACTGRRNSSSSSSTTWRG